MIAIFGRGLFWPAKPRRNRSRTVSRAAARVLTVRVVALVLGGACLVGLGALALHADRLRLQVSFVAALPSDSEPAQAARAAAAGFAPGVIAPTEVLLQGTGVADRQKLSDLSSELGKQPGVAGVLSPSALPDQAVQGALVTKAGDAARMLVVLDHDPLGATAISDLNHLSAAMPGLLQRAGLEGTRVRAGRRHRSGRRARGRDERRPAPHRPGRAAVNLLLLMLFLRAVVAPVLLLACSVLALAASLGCLALVFQDRFGHEGVASTCPLRPPCCCSHSARTTTFTGSVTSGRAPATPRCARRSRSECPRPQVRSPRPASPWRRASAYVALVPLRQFRELAFVMGLGVLIDAFVVRTVLVPALLSLLGRFSAWPRKLNGVDAEPPPSQAPAGSPDDHHDAELTSHHA